MKSLVLVVLLAALLPSGAAATAAKFNPDPVFPLGPISDTTSHEIRELDNVASVLANQSAVVNCWSEKDWEELSAWQSTHHEYDLVDAAGVTWFKTDHIELSPLVCEVLKQTLAKSPDQPLFEAYAIAVLAHESAHASGIHAENLAECRAIKTEPRAAELVGVPKAEAVRLQHIYRGTVYPYDEKRYRTPVCHAGLPEVVVPDTLGSSSALRPLQRTATAVIHALSGWKNMEGGAGTFGPLSPCSPIASRTLEAARYQIELLGPSGSSVGVSSVRLRAPQVFARALVRFRAMPRCSLASLRTFIREKHMSASVVLGRVPKAITDLSPMVHAYRRIWTEDGKRSIDDTIFIFDRATLEIPTLSFNVPAGAVPPAVEERATKAALDSLR